MPLLFLLIGCIIAAFGFAGMRDPMRFAVISTFTPELGAYYQRMVLDRGYRIPLRIVGMLTSFFGLAFFVAAVAALLKFKVAQILAEAFWVLMALSLASYLVFRFAHALVEAIRTRGADVFDFWKLWKQSAELGPAVVPVFDPRTEKETKFFTAVYSALVGATILIALLIAALTWALPKS